MVACCIIQSPTTNGLYLTHASIRYHTSRWFWQHPDEMRYSTGYVHKVPLSTLLEVLYLHRGSRFQGVAGK